MCKLFGRLAFMAMLPGFLAAPAVSRGQQPEYAPAPPGSQATCDQSGPTSDPSYATAATANQPQAYPHYLFVAPSYRGYGHPVAAQTYAYGWFGACAKSHAVFHWDYFNHCWIWW
jgi:hypothetical protein